MTSWRLNCLLGIFWWCQTNKELPENAADAAHLPTVHTELAVKALSLFGFRHRWVRGIVTENHEQGFPVQSSPLPLPPPPPPPPLSLSFTLFFFFFFLFLLVPSMITEKLGELEKLANRRSYLHICFHKYINLPVFFSLIFSPNSTREVLVYDVPVTVVHNFPSGRSWRSSTWGALCDATERWVEGHPGSLLSCRSTGKH